MKEESNKDKIYIEVGGEKLWYDVKEDEANRKFMKEKEQEYWRYFFSGQWHRDIFGK